MPINTIPPEGSNYSQEQWDVIVERTDRILNAQFRSYILPDKPDDPAVQNPDVFRLVTNAKGVSKLESIFKPGDEHDKYTQTKRLLEAANNKERLFFRAFREDGPIELSFTGDPPRPITRKVAVKPPNKPRVPVMPEREAPTAPAAPEQPSWIKRFLHGIFGVFADDIAAYEQRLAAHPAAVEKYNADRAAYDQQKERDRAEHEKAMEPFKKPMAEYELLMSDYQAELADKEALDPCFAPYKDEWKAKQTEDRQRKQSITASTAYHISTQVYDQREIERRFEELMGPKLNVKPSILRGAEIKLKAYDPDIPENNGQHIQPREYAPPEGVGGEWKALTLCACTNLGVMDGLTSSAANLPKDAPIELRQEKERFDAIGVQLLSNYVFEDVRCETHVVGMERAREHANKVWEDFAKGNTAPAAELFKQGIDYFTANLRASGGPTKNENVSGYYALKLLVECAEKHPSLAERVDAKIFQEARGCAFLYDEVRRSKEAHHKLLTAPPEDKAEREKLLTESLVGAALIDMVVVEKDDIRIKSEEFVLSLPKQQTDPRDYLTAIANLSPEELTLELADPKNVPKIKGDIEAKLKESDYFKRLMQLPDEEMQKEIREWQSTSHKARAEVVEQKNKPVNKDGPPKVQEQQAVKTGEVKEIPKPPVVIA